MVVDILSVHSVKKNQLKSFLYSCGFIGYESLKSSSENYKNSQISLYLTVVVDI